MAQPTLTMHEALSLIEGADDADARRTLADARRSFAEGDGQMARTTLWAYLVAKRDFSPQLRVIDAREAATEASIAREEAGKHAVDELLGAARRLPRPEGHTGLAGLTGDARTIAHLRNMIASHERTIAAMAASLTTLADAAEEAYGVLDWLIEASNGDDDAEGDLLRRLGEALRAHGRPVESDHESEAVV